MQRVDYDNFISQLKHWYLNYIGLCKMGFGTKLTGEISFPHNYECQAEIILHEMKEV